jgi:hypothetical protein
MFRLVSDVHAEFMKLGTIRKWVATCQPIGDQRVLVLAGDICKFLNLHGTPNANWTELMKGLKSTWPHVVYVPGNHEYYGSKKHHQTIPDVDLRMEHECRAIGIVWLQQKTWCVPDTTIRLVGCTLWSNTTPDAERMMNDSANVWNTNAEHHTHVSWLVDELRRLRAQSPTDPIVIVTHHLPSFACIHPTYLHFPPELHQAYATELITSHPSVFEPPVSTWFYGHSHERMEVTLGGVRAISNPVGYPGEKKVTSHFTHGLTI